MNWLKPHYEERRFGFEVTMYIYQAPNPSTTHSQAENAPASVLTRSYLSTLMRVKNLSFLAIGLSAWLATEAAAQDATLSSGAAITTTSNSSGDGISDDGGINGASWPLHGLNRFNSANASSISQINKTNLNNFQLKWVYSIPPIPSGPANPLANPRAENGASNGVAVDTKGVVYLPTFDGHMYEIDSFNTSGVDGVTGSPKPVVLNSQDFFMDPQFAGNTVNGFASRLHPSLINGAIYAGNYQFFNFGPGAIGPGNTPIFADKLTGTTNPTNLNFPGTGAVLYKINAKTGKLLWRSVIDSNQQTMIASIGVSQVPWLLGQNLIIVGFSSEISGTLGILPLSPDSFAGTSNTYRGGVAGVLESTGQVVWKTYTTPHQKFDALATITSRGTVNNWTGGSVWGGGNFPVSYKNHLVYTGTGEAFNAPDTADTCEFNRLSNPNNPILDTQCLKVLQNGDGTVSNYSFADSKYEKLVPLVSAPVLPHASSVVAYDYYTGHIQWAKPLSGYDVWNLSCFGIANFSPFCPPYLRTFGTFPFQTTFKDRDITMPILIENIKVQGVVRDIVLAFGKGAIVTALDAASGQQLWQSTAFGPGGLSGDGFVWGKAADGKRFYGNTGTSSGITLADYQAAQTCKANNNCNATTNPTGVVPGSCDLVNSATNGFGQGAGNPNDVWHGGMYVAVNLKDGSVAWQRCVIAKVIDPTSRLLVANGETEPGRSQAPVTVANGVVVAPGASSYIPFSTNTEIAGVYSEVVFLDADSGALLKTLPLSPSYSSPSASTLTYARPEVVGDRLYLTTGGHATADPVNDASNAFDRLLMYQLSH